MYSYQNNCCVTQNIYEVITPNLNLPITLNDAWTACRKEFLSDGVDANQDAWMTRAIKTAMLNFENASRRTLMKTGFRTFRDCWSPCFELRKSPLDSITSVKYNDEDNVEQTVDSADYYIQKDPAYSLVRFDSETFTFPELKSNRPQQIIIDFIAGYAQDSTEVPADIQQAILLQVCYLDANRGDCACGVGDSGAEASGASNIYRSYKIEEMAL